MIHSTEQGLKLQLLAVALIVALVFVHYLLWLDENGVRQTHTLRISIQAQTDENAELAERNQALAAEIEDLKRGLMVIEERARSEMGMVRPDETFYRLLEKPQSRAAIANKPTTPVKPTPAPDHPARTVKPASPIKPSAPATRPTSPAKPSAPATRPASPAKPSAPATRPASPAKPSAPATRPASPAKPSASTVKPAPPAKSPTPPAKPPASAARPLAPAPKTAPTPGASQRRE